MTRDLTRWWTKEDWLAVWLGGAILGLIVLGLRPALPSLAWRDLATLGAIFGPAVLGAWAVAGAAALLCSLPGIAVQASNLQANSIQTSSVEAGDAQTGSVRASRVQASVRYLAGFPVVFALAWTAMLLAGYAGSSAWGLEYVIFALLLGLLISNTVGTPAWLLEAARTEYFIKTGLVIMGATILIQEILQAGALGVLQAVGVVVVVWYVAFWIARRLRVDDELGVMIATAVSICGVSAAIAACGAIQGDRRKLSYVTSIVLIVAIPMIVLQPWIARVAGLPDVVAGAWLGGTLDTTGSVVAAGALISERAMKVGTIVKFSQNVLIGVAAFILSVWWSMRSPAPATAATGSTTSTSASASVPASVPASAVSSSHASAAPTGLGIIWDRFPKFVLGFLAASLLFSFVLDPALVARVKGPIGSVRTIWFALAFVSIGLETNVRDLWQLEGGRPFVSFVAAQAFNVLWTLLLAWLIFGGILLPGPVL